jgi:hypothetical protein
VIYELGVAIYLCQQFETNLLFLIALLSAHRGMVTADSFKEGICSYSEKTLGQLAKVFKSKLQLPEAYETYIRTGVETRNSIVHGFVMRNTEQLLSVDGRTQVIDELQNAQHIINDRLQSLNEVLDRALNVFGGSLEQLRKDVEFQFEAEGDVASIRH